MLNSGLIGWLVELLLRDGLLYYYLLPITFGK